jgi:hypothetical protein
VTRSLKTYVGNTESPVIDLTDIVNWDEAKFIQGSTQPGSSRLIVRDEEGVYDPAADDNNFVLGYHNVMRVVENASGSNVTLFRGRIEVVDTGRGPLPQKVHKYREHEITVSDYNRDLFGIDVLDFQTNQNHTDVQQVHALVDAYLSGSPRASTNLNDSLYVSSSNTRLIGSNFYTGVTPYEVLSDIADQAGKEFFVDVDGNLHYDGADSMAFLSSLRISDRTTDQSSNTFHPDWVSGAALHQEGTDVVTSVRSYWGPEGTDRNLVVRNFNDHKWDFWQVPFFDDRAKNRDAAERRAENELDAQGRPYKTSTCRIGPVPREWAGYIKAGQKIHVKARAMPGAETTFRWLRIAELSWEYVRGDPVNLLATVVLERPRIRRRGSGGGPRTRATDPEPAPACPIPDESGLTELAANNDPRWPGTYPQSGPCGPNFHGVGASGGHAEYFSVSASTGYALNLVINANRHSYKMTARFYDGDPTLGGNLISSQLRVFGVIGTDGGVECPEVHFNFTTPPLTTHLRFDFVSKLGGWNYQASFNEVDAPSAEDEDEFCVDYDGDCPKESPYFLPSDYVECRFDSLEDAIDEIEDDLDAGSATDFLTGALSNPPTQAEIVAIIGPADAVNPGTVFGITDASDTDKRYLAISDGTVWHIVPLVPPRAEATAAALTAAPVGGWAQTHSAHYYNGKTYFAYVRGDNGNVELRTYTHATGVVSSATVMRAALLNDLHATPSLVVRQSDHRIHAFYSDHAGSAMYQWVSTNPEDISAGTETNLDAQLGGTGYTYAMVTDLASGLFLWVRYSGGAAPGQDWGYSVTTDGGTTWAALTKFYEVTGRTAYPFVQKTGSDRADVVAIDGSTLEADTSLHFFSYSAATDVWTAADGTLLTLPVGNQPEIVVWDGSVNDVVSSRGEVGRGADDLPRLLFATTGTTHTYRHARWTGTHWAYSTLLSGGEPAVDNGRFDSLDTNTIYLANGNDEIVRLVTDDEVTWDSETIGTGGTNVYPISPVDHASDLPVVWGSGTYTSAATYSLGISGFGAAVTADSDHLQRIVVIDDTTLKEIVIRKTAAGAWEVSFDGSSWEALGGASGAAGGDLSGTYPNPSVVNDSHSHTSATAPGSGGMGPLMLASDHGTPIVFDDILQDSDGADFIYASEP